MKHLCLQTVSLLLIGAGCATADSFPMKGPAIKPRLVVMTDIGGDPDDMQSMVRFLLYTCDFEVEGLCTGFGFGHYQRTRPDLIREAVEAYGQVRPSLRRHRADYPSREALLALIKDGHDGDPHRAGSGMDSEASDWIVQILERPDPRPVWFSIWGGPRELAQALWKLQQTHAREELAPLLAKIRVHSIADQDRTAGWIKQHFPEVFWIYSQRVYRGIWKAGNQDLVSPQWLEQHVRTGHGPLGAWYPAKAAGKDGVKEGDTPSFLYVLDHGLSDTEQPGWGNWGGRFTPSGKGREFLPAEDLLDGRRDMLLTIHRWRPAYQNAFEARMDWCVHPPERANHAPMAVLNGDRTNRVQTLPADPGEVMSLTASGSSDPDGNTLAYHWWTYPEAGTSWSLPEWSSPRTPTTSLTIPAEAAGRSIHVILEVTDTGTPPLTAYRRMRVQVRGERVPPPPGTPLSDADLSRPVTRLNGPPAETGPWAFWRGVNLNGPPVSIDGQSWEGDEAQNFSCPHAPLRNERVALRPPTDPSRTGMIQSFRWDRTAQLAFHAVPPGTYAVYAYIWEETNPEQLTFTLNGKITARDISSGRAGRWQRLGPWITQASDGFIRLQAQGGAANFSGIEVWRKTGE